MTTYLLEHYFPGLSSDELALTAARGASVTAEVAATGIAIRYLGSTLVPADEASLCCFEAESAAGVAAANERAGTPFARIVETRRISRRSDSWRGRT